MVKILIIEDQVLLRDMIKNTILNETDFKVIGESSDAKDSISLCKSLSPDIVLMDICTDNNSSGIYYAGEIKKQFSSIKVIIMTGMPEINFINESRDNRIDSFIYKDISKDSLIMVIKNTLAGYSIYPDSTNKKIDNSFLSVLSEKELSILNLYCKGLERKQISEQLNISLGTLKTHISSILSKTNYDNLARLAIYCISEGLIVPNLKKK